jgi:hypothetical protein
MRHDFELHDLLLRRRRRARRGRLSPRTRAMCSSSADRDFERADNDLRLGCRWLWPGAWLHDATLRECRCPLGGSHSLDGCDYIGDEFFG